MKRADFWIRRKSHLPILAVGTLVVTLLVCNEDTSVSLNMEYDRQINSLHDAISACRDSAEYYRLQREAVIHGQANLEHLARERFHMQRPTEDVFIISEPYENGK